MRSTKSLIAMIALAAICGAGRAAAAGSLRKGPLANVVAPPVAMMAANTPKTDLDVFRMNTVTRKVEGRVGSRDWPDPIPGYNIVRAFSNSAGKRMLFVLNGNTGEAASLELNADGSIGSAPWTGAQAAELRCTNAALIRLGDVNTLVTQDSFSGLIRTFQLNDNGAPDIPSSKSKTVSDMRDKNLFSAYQYQPFPDETSVAIVGVDTWSGQMATYSIDLQKITTKNWTLGWTSIDHLRVNGVTYRLLYKAAGDPYKKPGENGDDARRLVLEAVSPGGPAIYDNPMTADGGDYSSARFVEFPSLRGHSNYGIFFYKRTTGYFALYEFDTQIGLGPKLDSGQLNTGVPEEAGSPPPYVDVEPLMLNGRTCLALVNADNAIPLGFEQAEKIGRIIDESAIGHSVGYQFMISQSGRIVFSLGGGKLILDHDPNAERYMTSRDQLNVGSVSKVITTVTALKLSEQGLDLNSRISNLVDQQIGADSWAKTTPAFNLFTHTSGLTKAVDGCTADPKDLSVDCEAFFNATPDSDPPCQQDGKDPVNCNRSYNNANFMAVRKIIENRTNAHDSHQIVDRTRSLWSDAAGLSCLTCQVNPDAYYFGPCAGSADCFGSAGKNWQRIREHDLRSYSAHCSSGGWYASSRDLIEFLHTIRYRRVLNQTSTNQLLQTDLKDVDGDATAFGWDPAWSAGGEQNLNKGGYAPFDKRKAASKSYITRLPNNCDAVLLFNTETPLSGTTFLKDAYQYVVLGRKTVAETDEYLNQPSSPAEGTVINTARSTSSASEHVTVSRDKDGGLKLKAYRSEHPNEYGGQLQFVTDKTAALIAPAVASSQIGVSDGQDFVTASLGMAGQLNLITWNFDGTRLTQHAIAFGPASKEVAVARIATAGPLNRIVTAIVNSDYKLQLDVWDFINIAGAPQLSAVTHKDTKVDKWAQAVAIKHIGSLGDLSQTAGLVTSHIGDSNELRVQAWTVDSSGHLLKTDDVDQSGVLPWVSSAHEFPTRIAIDTTGDGVSGFFDGHGFVTTFIAASWNLEAVTWSLDNAGKLTFKNNAEADKVKNQVVCAAVSVASLADVDTTTKVDEERMVKLIKWSVDSGGIISPLVSKTLSLKVFGIAAAGNLVTALQLDEASYLSLVASWKVMQ